LALLRRWPRWRIWESRPSQSTQLARNRVGASSGYGDHYY